MNPNKQITSIALLAIALVLLGVMGSFVTLKLMHRGNNWSKHDEAHGHHWLHNELNLTAEEAAAVDAFEPEYRKQRKELMEDFHNKINNLQQLLATHDAYNADVEHSIHELHIVHGNLQELSIRHYFQMMSVLPPEKQKHLKQIATEALSTPE